jgi:hypothetical protein
MYFIHNLKGEATITLDNHNDATNSKETNTEEQRKPGNQVVLISFKNNRKGGKPSIGIVVGC